MIGMEENLLPHRRAIESGEPHELEEERRLMLRRNDPSKRKIIHVEML